MFAIGGIPAGMRFGRKMADPFDEGIKKFNSGWGTITWRKNINELPSDRKRAGIHDGIRFFVSRLAESFNEMVGLAATKDVPALLFVNGQQTNLIKAAQLVPHRKLLSTPLKVRELRDALVKLLNPAEEQQVSEEQQV